MEVKYNLFKSQVLLSKKIIKFNKLKKIDLLVKEEIEIRIYQ